MNVSYASETDKPPSIRAVLNWTAQIFDHLPFEQKQMDRSVNVYFCGTKEIQEINSLYRAKNDVTNVLSFAVSEEDQLLQSHTDDVPSIGDIIICSRVVADEAKSYGLAYEERLVHMLLHALLHLYGHQHDNEKERNIMETEESRILQSMGFADPWKGNE